MDNCGLLIAAAAVALLLVIWIYHRSSTTPVLDKFGGCGNKFPYACTTPDCDRRISYMEYGVDATSEHSPNVVDRAVAEHFVPHQVSPCMQQGWPDPPAQDVANADGTVVPIPYSRIANTVPARSAVSALNAEPDNPLVWPSTGEIVSRLSDPYRLKDPSRRPASQFGYWPGQPGQWIAANGSDSARQALVNRQPPSVAHAMTSPAYISADMATDGLFGISKLQTAPPGATAGTAGTAGTARSIELTRQKETLVSQPVLAGNTLTGVGVGICGDPRFEMSAGMLGSDTNLAPGNHGGWVSRGYYTPADFRPVSRWGNGPVNGKTF